MAYILNDVEGFA